MELDRWEQIERLYHAALELDPGARDAFLDEACEGDEALRREVAGLLACDLPSDSFIQSPAIEIIDDRVDRGVLQEIHEQYVNLAQRHGVELPEFGESNLTGRELFIAFQKYLRGLTEILRRENILEECDLCNNGACPPCEEWEGSDYVKYLDDLKRKTQ